MFRKGQRHPLLSRNFFPDGSAQVTEWVLSEGCRRSPRAPVGGARPAARVPSGASPCVPELCALPLRFGGTVPEDFTFPRGDGHQTPAHPKHPLRPLGSLCDSLSLQDEYPWTHRGLGVTPRLPRVALPTHSKGTAGPQAAAYRTATNSTLSEGLRYSDGR